MSTPATWRPQKGQGHADGQAHVALSLRNALSLAEG